MYNTKLECIDWRYSAAILGLIRFFEHFEKENPPFVYQKNQDFIEFDKEFITRERYLEFVEYHYREDLPHVRLKNLLNTYSSKRDISSEEKKNVNELMKANTVLKKIFSKQKFEGNDAQLIIDMLDENRWEIIEESFRYKLNMYRNYCNTNLLGKEAQEHCRLLGYSIDEGRKSKSYSYTFSDVTGVFTDSEFFDFIPFAFSNTYQAIFINNSYNIGCLLRTNENLTDYLTLADLSERKGRKALYCSLIKASEFSSYDVEVIMKDRGNAYYETIFIRKEKVEILKSIHLEQNEDKKNPLLRMYKISDGHYLDVMEKTYESILNGENMDSLIEFFIKEDIRREAYLLFLVRRLIKVNCMIKEGEGLVENTKTAYAEAMKVNEKLYKNRQDNKIKSYKQKLISAMVAQDYDRVCDILLQLSAYTDIPFNFAYDLFEDFETHKDLAYTFINCLGYKKEKKDEE